MLNLARHRFHLTGGERLTYSLVLQAQEEVDLSSTAIGRSSQMLRALSPHTSHRTKSCAIKSYSYNRLLKTAVKPRR